MPPFAVEVHPLAADEAEAAERWYRERNESASDRFRRELDHAVDLVSERPEAGSPYISATRRVLLRRFPFFVVYRAQGRRIQIVAVAHARRRPGYKTLIDTTDRPIVVGRRGTGKSALAYRLERHWRTASRTETITLAPTEDQIIGLRALMPEFYGSKFSMIRAGARTAWRYSLLAETAHMLTRHYKFHRLANQDFLRRHADAWGALGADLSMRLRRKLLQVGASIDPSTRIAEIPTLLELNQLQDAVSNALQELKHEVVILIVTSTSLPNG